MKQVTVTLYEFKELNETVRDIVLANQRDFELQMFDESDYDESFEYTYEKFEEGLTDEYLIENIEANEYLYFFNGEMAHCVRYVQGAFPNPKAGTTEFKLYGETYIIKDGTK